MRTIYIWSWLLVCSNGIQRRESTLSCVNLNSNNPNPNTNPDPYPNPEHNKVKNTYVLNKDYIFESVLENFEYTIVSARPTIYSAGRSTSGPLTMHV